MTNRKIIDRAGPGFSLPKPVGDLLVSCSYIPFSTDSEKKENKEKKKKKKNDPAGDRIQPNLTIIIHARDFSFHFFTGDR
jgi:hypothetical protein